ncbi:hypothetical protein BGL_2c26400 [Burkholderia plantarii]|uniref:Transposase n=1 Tax=Burkholderia plantarii TaxID=41899 RepID=A0A0B6S8D2_BURPL|nr:hypothetical protein BGL_2c26400 [Burkholderia plantarii]
MAAWRRFDLSNGSAAAPRYRCQCPRTRRRRGPADHRREARRSGARRGWSFAPLTPTVGSSRRLVEPGQHAGIQYSETLDEAGIEPSVGSRGDSYDDALAETIDGLHGTERIHRRAPWKTRESVEPAAVGRAVPRRDRRRYNPRISRPPDARPPVPAPCPTFAT